MKEKRKLHIAYIMYCDLGQITGNAIHALEITKSLIRQGHRVDLVIPSFGEPGEDIGAGMVLIPTPLRGALGSLVFGFLLPFYLWALHRRTKIDILYTMQMPFVITPLLFALLTKIPHVVELHAIALKEIDLYKANLATKLLKKLIVWVTGQMYCRWSSLIVAVSSHIAQFVSEIYSIPTTRIAIIPNGVDIHTYKPMDTISCRRELGLPEDAVIIGYVGTFFSYHRMEAIVDVAKKFLSKCPQAYFVMVGSGPNLSDIKKRVEDAGLSNKFIFTGNVPAPLCAKYINTFNVGISFHHPEYGGFPMKILNYLACGKPVVSSRSPGTEFVAKYDLGILIETTDPEEVTLALLQAIAMNENEDFKLRARQVIEENYSWDAKALELISHLQAVC